MREYTIPCPIAQDLMPLVIDEACGEESRKAVEDHVASCPDCAKAFESMKAALPAPLVDAQADANVKKAMKKTRKMDRWLKIIAVCLALIVLISGVFVAMNPEVLFLPQTSAPASWFIDSHLVRTQDGALLLQFTPDQRMQDFYGFSHFSTRWQSVYTSDDPVSTNPEDGKAEIAFSYSWLARLLNLKKPNVKGISNKVLALPNGDWAVPLCDFVDIRYVDGRLLEAGWRPLTAEEIKAQVEKNAAITGRSLIFAYEQETSIKMLDEGRTLTLYESAMKDTFDTLEWSITGGGQRQIIYRPGDEIPLCDEQTEQLFQQWLRMHPGAFPSIGALSPDENQ